MDNNPVDPYAQMAPPPSQKRSIPIAAILAVLFLIGTVVMAVLAVSANSNYNELNSTFEAQVSDAVAEAREEQKVQDEEAFRIQQESDTRQYVAPEIFGFISVGIPKSWSIYVEEDETGGSDQIDLFAHPDLVKVSRDQDIQYGFRMTLEQEIYANAIAQREDDVEDGLITANSTEVAGISGTVYEGAISNDIANGKLVMIPVRDKTLTFWSESEEYFDSFDRILQSVDLTP